MGKAICEVRQDFFKGGRPYKKGDRTEDFSSEQAAGYSDYLTIIQVQEVPGSSEQNNQGSFQDNIHNTNIHSSKKKGGKKK